MDAGALPPVKSDFMNNPPKTNTIGQKLAPVIIRFSWLILLISAALSYLAFTEIKSLKVSTSLDALMPEGVPSVENLHRVLEKTGSFASIMIVAQSPDAEAGLKFIQDLRERITKQYDWIAAANYSEDISLFERHKLLYVETADLIDLQQKIKDRVAFEKQKLISDLDGIPVNIRLRSEPYFAAPPPVGLNDLVEKYEDGAGKGGTERLFQSDDGEVTILVVWPKSASADLNGSRRMIRDMEAAIAAQNPAGYHPDLKVSTGGRIKNRVIQFDAVISDVRISGIISGLLIALLLMAAFRNPLGVIYILLPLVAGIVWTFGVTAIVIGGLNLITVFLALILFGLGVDFGIHNMARYLEVRRMGGTIEEAVATIIDKTGRASLIAAITTAAGFYSLMLTDFRASSEFGFIAGTGLVLTFIAMYTAFPAFLSLMDRLRLVTWDKGRMAAEVRRGAFPYRKPVLILSGVLLAVAAFFATRVEYENNFARLQAEKTPEDREVSRLISRVFSGGTDRAVLFVETLEEVRAIEDYINGYILADTETPTIRKIESFYRYVPREAVQEERLAIIRDIHDMLAETDFNPAEDEAPENWRDYLDIGAVNLDDLPDGLQRVYTASDGARGYLIYIFNSVSMNRAHLARQFSDDVRGIHVAGRTYYPATEAFIFVDMLALMKKDAFFAVGLIGVITTALIFLFFRNIRMTLIVLSPAAAGLLLTFGVMGLIDLRLSIMNMVILPSLVGIGVDNGIHIVHRYLENRQDGILAAMQTTGKAAILTTLTTMLGFSGLIAADMRGLHSLGLLAVIGFTCCLIATFTLLPAFLGTPRIPKSKDQPD